MLSKLTKLSEEYNVKPSHLFLNLSLSKPLDRNSAHEPSSMFISLIIFVDVTVPDEKSDFQLIQELQ